MRNCSRRHLLRVCSFTVLGIERESLAIDVLGDVKIHAVCHLLFAKQAIHLFLRFKRKNCL